MSERLIAYTGVSALLAMVGSCEAGSHKDRLSDSPSSNAETGGADTGHDSAGDSAHDTGPPVTPGPWIALSCGDADCCAVADDNRLACWGQDTHGELDSLPDTTVAQVSVGAFGVCVLDESGAIACFPGDPDWPAPAGSFTAVVANGWDGCALDDLGALLCWGGNFSAPPPDGEVFPPNGQTFSTLAGGETVQGALDDAGTPTCWGSDDSYFTNASGYKSLTPTDSGFTSMVCGIDHCCVLDADGYPTCWGGDYTLTVEPAAGQFSSLSAGDNATCGVVLDGSEADCWGYGAFEVIPAPSGDHWAEYQRGGHGGIGCGLTVSGNIVCDGTDVPPSAP